MSESETLNHCHECGLDYFYAPELHECRSKGRVLPGAQYVGESWIDECLRKVRES